MSSLVACGSQLTQADDLVLTCIPEGLQGHLQVDTPPCQEQVPWRCAEKETEPSSQTAVGTEAMTGGTHLKRGVAGTAPPVFDRLIINARRVCGPTTPSTSACDAV
jgi:hypothetical protein